MLLLEEGMPLVNQLVNIVEALHAQADKVTIADASRRGPRLRLREAAQKSDAREHTCRCGLLSSSAPFCSRVEYQIST